MMKQRQMELVNEAAKLLKCEIGAGSTAYSIEKKMIEWCIKTNYELSESNLEVEDKSDIVKQFREDVGSGQTQSEALQILISLLTDRREVVIAEDGVWHSAVDVNVDIRKSQEKIRALTEDIENLNETEKKRVASAVEHELKNIIIPLQYEDGNFMLSMFSASNLSRFSFIKRNDCLARVVFIEEVNYLANKKLLGVDWLNNIALAVGKLSFYKEIIGYVIDAYTDVTACENWLFRQMVASKNEYAIDLIMEKVGENQKIELQKNDGKFKKGQVIHLYDFALNKGLSKSLMEELKSMKERLELKSVHRMIGDDIRPMVAL